MSVFDIFTNKAALSESDSFVGALDTGLEDYKAQLEAMPAFRPAVNANGVTNPRQMQYAQNNLIHDGNGGYYSPERMEKLQKYNQLQAVKDQQTAAYERKLNNPLFNIKDLGADIFRNTVGLVPNMLSGSEGYDPSQRETSNYRTAISGLVQKQQDALSGLSTARKERAQAFIGGIRKPIGTAVVDSFGNLGIPTTDSVEGGVRFDPILTQDGSVVGKPRNTMVALGGGGQGFIDLSSPDSPVQTVVSSADATSANASSAGAQVVSTALAEDAVGAAINLQSTQDNARTMSDLFSRIRNHRGREAVLDSNLGTLNPMLRIPNSAELDFNSILKELQGDVFMTAYKGLKGGGQITEIEGEKAEQAIQNMTLNQSKEQFMESLDILENIVMQATREATNKANKLRVSKTSTGVTYQIVND
jgi:hypothetical protein